MRVKSTGLSPHSRKVLALLSRSVRPLSAYEILDKLRGSGIKAPPTVYRALQALVECGKAHRIESLNAFVACHGDHEEGDAGFAVCRSCGTAVEIQDSRLAGLLSELGKKLDFHIEHEMLELSGTCRRCSQG